MKNRLKRSLLRFAMAHYGLRYRRPVVRLARNPARAQADLLGRILRDNADTEFGRRHHFANIRNVEDFRTRVEIQDYESLRPFIQPRTGRCVSGLTRDKPVFYARTSGTTGEPKDIPVTRTTMDRYREGQRLYAHSLYRAAPGAFAGRILALGGPPREGLLECGTPYGSMSGLLYGALPTSLRSRYVLTPDTLSIADHEARYLAVALESAAAADVTLIAAVNPSTLLRLVQVIRENTACLVRQISRTDPIRGQALQALVERRCRITFADLWPDLAAVATWTGGNCTLYRAELAALLPPHTRIVELGYLASECRGSIVIDALSNRQIPNLRDNFFEFVERQNWESGRIGFLGLEQLQPGCQYYVFITTPGGLYRYHINDVVEVDGWYEATPTIHFVRKGRGITSLTGEKLDESQVVRAMSLLMARHRKAPFFVLLASRAARHYRLYVESRELDTDQLDRLLGEQNIEFRAKRDSGRLAPLATILLRPGAGEAYRDFCIARGQRESQFKLMHLQYEDECDFDFARWARTNAHVPA